MESIQNQFRVRTVILYGTYIGLAHIARCPFDLALLVVTEHFIEELINSFALFAFANPNNTRSVKVIDDSGIFMPFTVGDLINANRFKTPNPVPVTYAGNSAMEMIRESRFWDVQYLCGSFLSH
jgi:hypothetical protein